MPSPFPGMNPYIEQRGVFHSFHQSSISIIGELLNAQLPPGFYTAIESDLYIHELPADQRHFAGRGDVAIRRPTEPNDRAGGAATAVQDAPAYGAFPTVVDELRLDRLELREVSNDRIVTVIEMLSPSNKYAGSDRDRYLQKRYALIRTDASLVEMDLLRGGPRLPLEGMVECDYCVLVGRASDRPRVGIWPMRLRERLPRIPIPLRPGYADLSLELQMVVDLAYDRLGCARYIYRGEPEPALSRTDAEWAQQFIPPADTRSAVSG